MISRRRFVSATAFAAAASTLPAGREKGSAQNLAHGSVPPPPRKSEYDGDHDAHHGCPENSEATNHADL